MFIATSVEKQYDGAAADGLRILVTGAGVAGATVAQLLRRAGRHPVLIERTADTAAAGYMLALMPMVDPALGDLGVRAAYRAASVPLRRYATYGRTGRRLRADSTATLMARFGDYRGIARGDLLGVLSSEGCPVTFGATITGLAERDDAVEVEVSTGDERRRLDFDLVVVADGMSSTTRDLLGAPVDTVDSGWGGWVAWAPGRDDADAIDELWGDGFFVGSYPVAGGSGVFVGGPHGDTAAGPKPFAARIRRTLTTVHPTVGEALAAVEAQADPYYWSLTDCRARVWITGRSVLLGDAAAGFLPTAGIGAGMAMESAWVLSRMLRDVDRARLPDVLAEYERRQRPRVEAAHDNSRQLARLVFHRSRLLAIARELAVKVVSVDRALRPIQRLLAAQPDPDSWERIGEPQR